MPVLIEAMPFGSLWLPVVVSAVAVFIASSILHMVVRHHKADYKTLSNDDVVREVLRKGNPSPGIYMTPACGDMKQMRSPEMMEKFKKGPVALLTIHRSGMPNMGKHLALWFLFNILVSFTAAYIARHTLQFGADGMLVMRITGAIAFVGYGYGSVVDSIWRGQPWSNTMRDLFDSAVCAVVCGLTFRFLWPAA